MKCTIFLKAQITVVFCIAITFTLVVDAAKAATFVTVDGEAVIEAENFTRRGGSVGGQWSLMTDLSGYNGTGYIESGTDDPSTLSFSSNIISAQYDINFRQTGTYYIHLRTYSQDHSQNGFFATIDGTQIDYGHEDAYYIFVMPLNHWHWYTDGGGEGNRGHLLSFKITEPGVKTLAIYRRDKSTKIDRIWITQTTSAPQNVGSLTLPNPNSFIVSEDPEICNDGQDNNNNGLTDCDDPGCESYAGCFPESECDNGLDDDMDGLTDCDDSDCESFARCIPESACDNGLDDDLDGLTDCDDSDCESSAQCPESACDNGLDDDLDGLTDCDDSDCESFARCIPESACDNGLDDDLDGLTDCDDTDCSERDSDNDGVTDCIDAFPQDPHESQDTDMDGTGDDADTDDDNDTVLDSEENGMNGDVSDYDGDSDGEPDSKQNSVVSLHSETGADYLTFSITGGQGTFTRLTTTTASTAPEGAVLGYELFDLGMNMNGANADVVLYLPTGETIDAIYMLGPTPDDSQDHWYRFDFDGTTGAEISGNVVTLHFVDGQRGDHDLTSNGAVSTLIGPADLNTVVDDSSTPPDDSSNGSTGGGGGSSGCFIHCVR
jgi:hypothetical protein